MNHTNTNSLDVARGLVLVRNNLDDCGFTPRDADGNDYQRGKDNHLRFKVGTAYMEVTTMVLVDNKQVDVIRATSWSSLDRMLLQIRAWIDNKIMKETGL